MSYKEFNKMLDNLYESLDTSTESSKFYISEPKFNKKPTRLDWLNVNDFLRTVNRHPSHFLSYIINVRKLRATYDGKIMMLQGKYKKDDLTKIMTEYIQKYCKCSICGSFDTTLLKDTSLRKDKLSCNKCKSVNYC